MHVFSQEPPVVRSFTHKLYLAWASLIVSSAVGQQCIRAHQHHAARVARLRRTPTGLAGHRRSTRLVAQPARCFNHLAGTRLVVEPTCGFHTIGYLGLWAPDGAVKRRKAVSSLLKKETFYGKKSMSRCCNDGTDADFPVYSMRWV